MPRYRPQIARDKSGPSISSDPLLGPLINKPKKPQKPPKPPKQSDPEVQAARDREREEARKRKGRRAATLTSPLGDPGEAPTRKKALLGA